MRTSSVRTAIAALTISITLLAAVPSADARPAQTRETNVGERAGDGPADRAFRAVQRVLRRLIGGGVTTNGDGVSVPTPGGGK